VSLIRSVTEFEFTVNDTDLEQAATGTGDMAYVKGAGTAAGARAPVGAESAFEIRYRLAWDGKLVSVILGVFLRVVYGSYRRQAKQQGHAAGRCVRAGTATRPMTTCRRSSRRRPSGSFACFSGAACWNRATLTHCGSKSPCWPPSPPPQK
jgi:hypothetical protein